MKNKKPQITELFAKARETKLTATERWSAPVRIMGVPGFVSDAVAYFYRTALSGVQCAVPDFSPAAWLHKPIFAGIASLLLLAGTAGGAFAFVHSAPGDLLYPLKVSAVKAVSQTLAVLPLPQEVSSAINGLLEEPAVPNPSSLTTPAVGENQDKEELIVVPASPPTVQKPVQVPVPETRTPAAGQPAAPSALIKKGVPDVAVPSLIAPADADDKTEDEEESNNPVEEVIEVVKDIQKDLPDIHVPLGL